MSTFDPRPSGDRVTIGHNAGIAEVPPPNPRPPADPVRDARARWQAVAHQGQRVGYLLIGVAVAAFGFGLVSAFTDTVTWVVGLSLALATATLAPAMVLGYAVKAADREDRARGR